MRTFETGTAYNASPRDDDGPPVGKITGRLQRAQKNLFETLPLFIGAVLIAHVAWARGSLTGWGVALYFWARVVYLPLYAFGVPYVRSLVWLVSLAGLIMVLVTRPARVTNPPGHCSSRATTANDERRRTLSCFIRSRAPRELVSKDAGPHPEKAERAARCVPAEKAARASRPKRRDPCRDQ